MITCIGPNVDARSFWFWKKKPVEYGSGNCGLPVPPRVDLICKGCESKCIEFEEIKKKRKFFTFKKKPEPKKKPDNCKEEEKPVEEKYTLWETIFGPNPKRFWPDPCTCKLALREKRNKRICDPRLQDSRYELTAGDVFLYTETLKSYPKGCIEPQPKPPPSYKVPRAALSKMLSSANLVSVGFLIFFFQRNLEIDFFFFRTNFSTDKGTIINFTFKKISWIKFCIENRRLKLFVCDSINELIDL